MNLGTLLVRVATLNVATPLNSMKSLPDVKREILRFNRPSENGMKLWHTCVITEGAVQPPTHCSVLDDTAVANLYAIAPNNQDPVPCFHANLSHCFNAMDLFYLQSLTYFTVYLFFTLPS